MRPRFLLRDTASTVFDRASRAVFDVEVAESWRWCYHLHDEFFSGVAVFTSHSGRADEVPFSMGDAFESLPDFKNRAVTCYVSGVPAENAVTLDSPVFELQAGRIFLAGPTVAAAPDDWTRGVRVCVAWDEVVQYMVFESSDEFRSRIGADPPGGFLGFLGRR